MIKLRPTAFALLLTLVLMACSGGGESAAGKADDAKAAAPAGTSAPAMDSAGLNAYIKAHAGKPTLLIFWATWCPSCKQALPEMEALAGSPGDKANILALSLDQEPEKLKAYLAKHPMAMPVYLADQALAERFGIEAIPTLVIFDKAGRQIFGKPGAFPKAMLEKVVDDLNSK